jgi:ferredoxin
LSRVNVFNAACVFRWLKTEGEPVGLSFQGRGFDEEIAVPLNKSFACGLTKAAKKCVETCPTGALAIKEQCTGDGHNEIT